MALQFPSSPSVGQTYQSGSSPTYTYNGRVWTLSNGNTGISNLNAFTASVKQALQLTGSNATMLGNLNVQGTQTALNQASLQITDKFIRVASGSLSSAQSDGAGIVIDGANVTMSWDSNISKIKFNTSVSASSFYGDGSGLTGVTSYTNSDNLSYLNTKGVISGSSQVIGILSSVNTYTGSNDTKWNTIQNITSSLISATGSYETKGRGIISGSSQLTSSYDSRYVISGSITQTTWDNIASKPTGIISGSSQLTSSYDSRYALSGSGGSATIPAGTVSGSSQLTSSYDGRYLLTASFNSFTASAQTVTTGSNRFNGTQTITGSLVITSGSFIGSQILANTSSLYLTSGSNLYMQNNGLVEITGSLNVKGTTTFVTAGGDEGGEINFGIAQTNTTLQNRVTTDIWRDRFRIFEGSANAKGVYVDLSKAPDGASGEITWKASGMVNAGTFVQLDNIKATVTSSGQRGLSLATVSGTFSYNIGGNFGGAGVGSGGTSLAAQTLTTTPTTSIFGWGFGAQSETSTYILADITNSRAYRITLQINGSYLNNFISIERLH